MSIPRRFPHIAVGNSVDMEAWRVTGLNDANSDRGLLYVDAEDDGAGGIRIKVFSDFDKTVLVAQGNGPVGAGIRITATEQADSGLTVSVIKPDTSEITGIELWVQLATLADIAEREDDARGFFLGDPPEVNFDVVALATMRKFYLGMQANFPPPQRTSAPLAFLDSSPTQKAGRRGLPDSDGIDLWALNVENDWELVGLQNVGDWKEWAILWSLHLIWKRKAGGSEDPLFIRSESYKQEAKEAWRGVPVQVDIDHDKTPDREIVVETPLLERG